MKTRIYILTNTNHPAEEPIKIYDHPLYLKENQTLDYDGKLYKVKFTQISLTDNCFKIFIIKV